jgi:tetratricopeptide (TPR) repeat protein
VAEVPHEEESSPIETDVSKAEVDGIDSDSTGDAALDRQLSKPAIEGLHGIDTAQVWIAGFLIVIAGLIAYSNAFTIPFHYLDQQVIERNPDAHRISTIPQALEVEPSAPLPMLTFAVNWILSGGNPFLFHAVNVLLHVLNALLVFLLCRRLLPEAMPEPVPMLAGLFVALNPLATESVNYIVGRSALMATFFSLLAVLLFVRSTTRTEGVSPVQIGLSLLSMLAAWCCNPVAVLIPLFVFAVDWIMHGNQMLRRATIHGAYWALAGVVLVSWFAAQESEIAFSRLVSDAPEATSVDYAVAFMRGLEKTVSPVALTPDYNLPPHVTRSFLDDQTVSVGLSVLNGAVLVIAALVLLLYRSMIGFALLWFVAGLLWTTFTFSAADPFSERGLYFPLCGIVMVIPWLIAKALSRRLTQIAASAAAVILLVAAGSGTFLRNRDWQDPQSLWEDAAAKDETSPIPFERLGERYFEQGTAAFQESVILAQEGQGPAAASRREEAMLLFNAAEETLSVAFDLNPGNATTVYRLGRCASYRGEAGVAVERLREALWLDPGNLEYTSQLALNLMVSASATGAMSDRLHAIDYFERAEALGQLRTEMRSQFALLLTTIGDLDRAEAVLTEVVGAVDNAQAEQQLAQIRRTRNLLAEAEQRARQMLAADPSSVEGLRIHAEVLMGRGMLLQASYVLARLLRQHPDDVASWVMMGTLRAMVNDEADFLSKWPNAPVSGPGERSAWIQLAGRCAASSRWNAARTYLEAAAGRDPEVALPLVTLSEIALSLDAVPVATQYLEEATGKYPDSARAWLLLCDIAIASDNLAAARRYLGEAEERGAPAAEVEKRRAQIGSAPVEEQEGFQTILR